MSINSEEESFTKVGFSEGEESLPPTMKNEGTKSSGAGPQSDEEEAEVLVHLQIPPHFSAGGGSTESLDKSNKNKDSQSLSSQSEASSFIPIRSFGRLDMSSDGVDVDNEQVSGFNAKGAGDKGPNTGELLEFAPRATAKDDASEVSDWSVVSSFEKDTSKTEDQDDASVAASSTISGFDLISLNGSSSQTQWSKGCYNPTLEADELLARTLQKEEEEQQALEEETCRQRKRFAPSQGNRGQELDIEILSVVEACRLTQPSFATTYRTGFSTLPQANLARLASKFIKCVNRMQNRHHYASPVTLCYCYTAKDSKTMNSIRQDGFGEGAKFGSTPHAAYKALYGLPPDKRGRRLETIMEQGGFGSDLTAAIDFQGWIAAIVSGAKSSSVVVSSGSALVYSCERSAQSLPLVSFDVTLMGQDIIRCLLNGLTTCLRDFFSPPALPHEALSGRTSAAPESPKRQKLHCESFVNAVNNDKTDDEAVALALQASLFEEVNEDDHDHDEDDETLHGESFMEEESTQQLLR